MRWCSGARARRSRSSRRRSEIIRLEETIMNTVERLDIGEHRSYRHIQVQPIAGALGAEVRGVDVSRPLAAQVVAEIRQAWLDHLGIFIHEQQLTPQELLALPRPFADPMDSPQFKGLRACPLATP